jgi:sarcosine oxidase subunit gamma
VTADVPVRRSPLGAESVEPLPLATSAGVVIQELPFIAQLDLRLDPRPAALDEAERALGVRPPASPNRVADRTGLRALWLGPDEWLIVGSADDPEALERRVVAAVAPVGGTVVEVSAARTILELRGPRVRDLLARGCSIDLHPNVFAAGTCAQTALAHVDVILECVAGDRFRVFVRTSFAPYLAAWLADSLSLMDSPGATEPWSRTTSTAVADVAERTDSGASTSTSAANP